MFTKKMLCLLLVALSIFVIVPHASAATENEVSVVEPPIAIPQALLHTSLDLSKANGSLHVYVSFIYGSQPESTYYNVVVQQYTNGSWRDYASYHGASANNHYFSFSKSLQPPTGYSYRVKLIIASSSFPYLDTYSRTVHY